MHLFQTFNKKADVHIECIKRKYLKKNMIAKSGAETSLIESHI